MAGVGGLFSPPSSTASRPRPRQDALVSPPGIGSTLSPGHVTAPLTSTSIGMGGGGLGPSFGDRTIPMGDSGMMSSLRTPSAASSFAPLSSSRALQQQALLRQEQEEQALRHEYDRKLKQLTEDNEKMHKRFTDLKRDATYNLQLIDERDRDLATQATALTAASKQLKSAETELRESKRIQAELESQWRQEQDRARDLDKNYRSEVAELKAALDHRDWTKDDEIRKTKENMETLRRELTNQLADKDAAIDKQRRELTMKFDQNMIDAEEVWSDKEAKLRDTIDRAERRAKQAEADSALLQAEQRDKKQTVEEVERLKRDAESRATHLQMAKGQVEVDMQIEIDRHKQEIKQLNDRLSQQGSQIRDDKHQFDLHTDEYNQQVAKMRVTLEEMLHERDRQHAVLVADHNKRLEEQIAHSQDLEAEINALRAEKQKVEKDVADAHAANDAHAEATQRDIEQATINKEREIKELKTELWTRDRELASMREKVEAQKKSIEDRRTEIIQLRHDVSAAEDRASAITRQMTDLRLGLEKQVDDKDEKLSHATALLADAKGGLRVTAENRDGHSTTLLEKDHTIARMQHQIAMLQTEIHSLRDGDGQAAHIRRTRISGFRGGNGDEDDSVFDGESHVHYNDGDVSRGGDGGNGGTASPGGRSQSGRSIGGRSPNRGGGGGILQSPGGRSPRRGSSTSPRPGGGNNDNNGGGGESDGKRSLRPSASNGGNANGGTGGDAPNGHGRTSSDPPPLRRMQSMPLPLKHRNFQHESVAVETLATRAAASAHNGGGSGSSNGGTSHGGAPSKRGLPTPSTVPQPQPLDVSARSMSVVAEESGRLSSRDTSRVAGGGRGHNDNGDEDDDMVRIGDDDDRMARAPSRGGQSQRPGSSHGSVPGEGGAAGQMSRLDEIKRRFAADQKDSTATSTSIASSDMNSPDRASQPSTPRIDGMPGGGGVPGTPAGSLAAQLGGAAGGHAAARPYSAERFETSLPAPLPASPYAATFPGGSPPANPFGYPPAGSPPELIIQAFQRENAYLRDRCHQLEDQNNAIRSIVKEMREEMEKIASAHARRLSPEPFDTENEVQIRNLRQHNALIADQLDSMQRNLGQVPDNQREVSFMRNYLKELSDALANAKAKLIHAKARARASVAKEREEEGRHNSKLQKEIEDVNGDNRELRKRLRDANADLQRLVNEREKLMDISNMLKADLSRVQGSGGSSDPLSYRRPSDAALYDPSSSSRSSTPTPSSVQLLLGGGAAAAPSRRAAAEPLSPAAQGPTAIVVPTPSSQRLSAHGALSESLISADDSEIDDLRLSRRIHRLQRESASQMAEAKMKKLEDNVAGLREQNQQISTQLQRISRTTTAPSSSSSGRTSDRKRDDSSSSRRLDSDMDDLNLTDASDVPVRGERRASSASLVANAGSTSSSRRSSSTNINPPPPTATGGLALTGKHASVATLSTRPRVSSSTERTTASQQAAMKKAAALASDRRRSRVRNYATGH